MVYDIRMHIEANRWETPDEFNSYCRPVIARFINAYNSVPDFLRQMDITLDDPNAMQRLRDLQSHHFALTMIQAQNVNMRVQILNRGEEAYDVRKKGNIFTRFGRLLDDPTANTRFGRRLQRRPGLKEAFSRVR